MAVGWTPVSGPGVSRCGYRPSLLNGFLASTGLDLTPFCNLHI